MIPIIICGKHGDHELKEVFFRALKQFGVWYYDGITLERKGEGSPKFIVYESEQIPLISLEKGILFFKKDFCGAKVEKLPSGMIAVFESYNAGAVQALQGTGTVAITCGSSAQDTLSAASLGEGKASVSLQRTVKSLGGDILEPSDISVSYKKKLTLYQLLAASAILLLSFGEQNGGFCLD